MTDYRSPALQWAKNLSSVPEYVRALVRDYEAMLAEHEAHARREPFVKAVIDAALADHDAVIVEQAVATRKALCDAALKLARYKP